MSNRADQTISSPKSVLRILVQRFEGGHGRVMGVEVLPEVWFLHTYHQALCLQGCPTKVGEWPVPTDGVMAIDTPLRWQDISVQVLFPDSPGWAEFRALAVVFVNARIDGHRAHHRQHFHLPDPLRGDYRFVE